MVPHDTRHPIAALKEQPGQVRAVLSGYSGDECAFHESNYSQAHGGAATCRTVAPRRILIVQLQRVGDLIQTTPLIRDLHFEHPGAQVELLCVENWSHVLEGFEGLCLRTVSAAKVVELEGECDHARASRTQAIRTEQLIKELCLPAYDEVINLTPTFFAAYLTFRLATSSRQGWIISDLYEFMTLGDWMSFFISAADFRREQFFNVVDLFRGHARGPVPCGGDRPYIRVGVAPEPLPPGRMVAINPGASVPERRWSAANFAALVRSLHASGFHPVLVGSGADHPVCEEVRALSESDATILTNLSIADMAALFQRTELVISNDTGAVHIAAGVGAKLLSLARGESFMETMPWGAGNVVLQGPVGPIDRLSFEAAMVAVEYQLGRISREDLVRDLTRENCACWESYFLPASADPLGGVAYRPLHREEPSATALFHRILRHVFAWSFRGASGNLGASHLQRPALDRAGLGAVEQTVTSARMLLTQLEAGAECAIQAVQEQDASKLERATQELTVVMDTLLSLAVRERSIAPVVHFLDWKLRFVSELDGLKIFEAHRREYARALLHLEKAQELAHTLLG